jgi:hypothetical protein
MAAGEDQAQALVRKLVRRAILGDAPAQRVERLQRRALLGERPLAADAVDGLVARDLRDPRPRIPRDPVARPALQRDYERLLDGLLRQVEIADRPNERRDRPPRLTSEQAVDDCRWTTGALLGRACGGGPYDAAFSRSSGWT